MFEAIAVLEGAKITCSDSIRVTGSRANIPSARPKTSYGLSSNQ
jgi:hypothetical protein